MRYDVVIAGAGPAGFGASLGAARAGKCVLLLDRNAGPGGVSVYSGCPVFSGIPAFEPDQIGGVGGEFAAAMKDHAFIVHHNTLNSSEFEIGLCMTRMLREAGVTLLFYATLIAAETAGGRIRAVGVACCGQSLRIEADAFVDATGDAVLSRLAGAQILPRSDEESMTKTVLFRVSGVKGFDKQKLLDLFPTLDFPYPFQTRFMGTPVGDGSEILLNLTAIKGDALDPFDLTRMDIELREQIPVIVDWIRRRLPGFEEARVTAVAPVIGVRASCNVKGKVVITAADLNDNPPVAEPVAVGKRSYGDHYVNCFDSPWRSTAQGHRAIPYGALLPLGLDNLAVGGRCISIETRAVSGVRLMPVCMATGQAAGVAAALGFPAYPVLRAELLRQKCRLEPQPLS